MTTTYGPGSVIRAHRLSLLHGTTPLLSLQRSRVIPKDYQLVPVVMSLEMPPLDGDGVVSGVGLNR